MVRGSILQSLRHGVPLLGLSVPHADGPGGAEVVDVPAADDHGAVVGDGVAVPAAGADRGARAPSHVRQVEDFCDSSVVLKKLKILTTHQIKGPSKITILCLS